MEDNTHITGMTESTYFPVALVGKSDRFGGESL